MGVEQNTIQIETFSFEDTEQAVRFVETMQVTDGVECDVYAFEGDPTKDLGIIRIAPGKRTPLQRVLKGERTVEGYISGKGRLVITKPAGNQQVYDVGDETEKPVSVDVQVGELMQWQAADDSPLTAYEICFPPYEDGRYENIE